MKVANYLTCSSVINEPNPFTTKNREGWVVEIVESLIISPPFPDVMELISTERSERDVEQR